MVALGTVFPLLGIIIVALRFRARQLQKSKYGLDDWLIIPALILEIGMGASIIVGVKGKALGYPNPSSAVEQASNFEELTLKTQSLAGKTSYIFQILAPLGLGFIKCSIVSLYRRIFCVGIGRGFRSCFRVHLRYQFQPKLAACARRGSTMSTAYNNRLCHLGRNP